MNGFHADNRSGIGPHTPYANGLFRIPMNSGTKPLLLDSRIVWLGLLLLLLSTPLGRAANLIANGKLEGGSLSESGCEASREIPLIQAVAVIPQQSQVLAWVRTQGEWTVFPVPHQLPDGRLLFLEGNRIVRWQSNGAVDRSFGQGSGTVSLPGVSSLMVHLADDGALTLLNGNHPGTHSLRRLLPDSSRPGGLQLRRLLPDGRNDPDFAPRPGLSRLFEFDELGRVYFQLDPDQSTAFGDPGQGGLIRFLSDGGYDDAYRPVSNGRSVKNATISRDGSALVVIEPRRVLEFDPDGRAKQDLSVSDPSVVITSASRDRSGRLRVSLLREERECESGGHFMPGHCWSVVTYGEAYLMNDGSLEPAPSEPAWTIGPMDDPAIHWTWPEAYPLQRLHRTVMVPSGSQVGLAKTVLSCQ